MGRVHAPFAGGRNSDKITDAVFVFLLILLGAMALYPIWFVVIASISDPKAVAEGSVIIVPRGITFEGYRAIFSNQRIGRGYLMSMLYMLAGNFFLFFVTLPCAYALSRKKLKGRRVIGFLFVIAMYVSGGTIANYLVNKWLGLLNTFWVIVLPSSLNVYYMMIERTSFETAIPEAVHESAQMDGANDYYFFFHFALPMIRSTIAVIFLFNALLVWNNYVNFLIYITNPALQSLQVVIREITVSIGTFIDEFASSEARVAASNMRELLKYGVVVVAAVPFLALYPFVQRHFQQGLNIGAVKE
jgi:putative aldouronate transport system permease protein